MEVYKAETAEVIRRFLSRELDYSSCIAALDAALAGVLPRPKPNELKALRAVVLANNEIVRKEMDRRKRNKGKPE
ncbi:MAG: hypothetical protein LAO55_01895 [Acidobacteriia bacterium]|nr:hypothetical protein [Terriglobia bacterium]